MSKVRKRKKLRVESLSQVENKMINNSGSDRPKPTMPGTTTTTTTSPPKTITNKIPTQTTMTPTNLSQNNKNTQWTTMTTTMKISETTTDTMIKLTMPTMINMIEMKVGEMMMIDIMNCYFCFLSLFYKMGLDYEWGANMILGYFIKEYLCDI